MHLPVTIRSVQDGDAAAIAAIYAEHVRTGIATFDLEPPTLEDTARKIATIRARDWPFLVACVGSDDVPAGYAYATQFRDRVAYSLTCENSIYVRAELAGRGIGRQLLEALIEAATMRGFRQMIAVVGGASQSSVALHEALGFRHAGRLEAVGRKFGRWLDTVYMQRALGEGATRGPDEEPS